MNKVITISRLYGSGGREIGKILAKQLDIPFYDYELIERAANESGFAKEIFENAESKATNSFLYSIAMGMSAYGNQELGYNTLSLDDRIYLAQSEVIRKYAQEGPCVIVGRCADFVLRDMPNLVSVFVWADIDYRIKRAMERNELDEDRAKQKIKKIDKQRRNYYNYHANNKWGLSENYDLSIRSDRIGIEKSAKVIEAYVKGMDS
ncbi:MAG: cytidylate kinase-like family protein [Clostridiales bacterium]|nr:cytidylate kinase-like family protein [Clostridiales bacterium]